MADFARGFRLTTADGTQLDGAQFPNGFVVTTVRDKGIDLIAISIDALLEHVEGASIEWDPNHPDTNAKEN